jgi:hypothetical protein
MQQNDAVKKHCCELCNYATIRKYDLKRHQNAKHSGMVTRECIDTLDEKNVAPNGKNVAPNEKNVAPNEKNVNPNGKNVNPQLICKILECNTMLAKFAMLECLIFATYFYFLYFKIITKYNYKLFPKNGKLIF